MHRPCSAAHKTYVDACPPNEENECVVLLPYRAPRGVEDAIRFGLGVYSVREGLHVPLQLGLQVGFAFVEGERRDLDDGGLERLVGLVGGFDVQHRDRALGFIEDGRDGACQLRVGRRVVHELLVMLV